MIRINDNVNGRGDRALTRSRLLGRARQRASSGSQTHQDADRLPDLPRSDRSTAGSRFHCRSQDGVDLSGLHLPGPGGGDAAGGPAFVVGHGFTQGVHKAATLAVMRTLARHGGVVGVDFRGHGRSGGRSSVGRDETFDLDAAVRWTRLQGYGPVTVVGFSMGAAVALRHGAIGSAPADAVVGVSSPSRWYMRESAQMRRVHWLLEHPLGPIVGRALGVRLGDPWCDLPASPVEAVAMIGRPVLLIHGTADGYFNPLQARALQLASNRADLWIEPGMGHGEAATTPALAARIAEWSEQATADLHRHPTH